MAGTEHDCTGDGWLSAWQVGNGTWAIDDNGQDTIYLVVGAERALLVDTGWGVGDLAGLVASLTDRPLTVVNTHGHPDHACGNAQFPTVHIAEADATYVREPLSEGTRRWIRERLLPRPFPAGFDPERWATAVAETVVPITDGHTFDLGERTLEAIVVPGHSPGSLCLLDHTDRLLLTGDSVLAGTVWLHLEESAPLSRYLESLRRLQALAGAFGRLLPAHGEAPLSPGILDELAAGVEAVLAGRATGIPEKTFAGDGLCCDFGSCALLYRPDRL